jgi:hypothetical protein
VVEHRPVHGAHEQACAIRDDWARTTDTRASGRPPGFRH